MTTFAQPPKLSDGVYRIPYSNGTDVRVTRDWSDHTPIGRIDMVGTGGSTYTVVAAASGVIKWIDDTHIGSCNLPGCSDCNNYIWIEHVNGEWTKYTHLQTGSITGFGRFVGETVCAGARLGLEGDIGFTSGGASAPPMTACDNDPDIAQQIQDSIDAGVQMNRGQHLHFEVAVPDDITDPFDTIGGFINGSNRIPVFCGAPQGMITSGNTYTANTCATYLCLASVFLPNSTLNNPTAVFAGSLIDSDNNNYTLPDSARVLHQSGGSVVLRPGFDSKPGAQYNARIGGCLDFPGSTSGCTPFSRDVNPELLEIPSESSWRVFPNPTTGRFGIMRVTENTTEHYSIEIFNATGKRILYKTNITNSNVAVDLSAEPQGIYSVRIHADNDIKTHRVVVVQ